MDGKNITHSLWFMEKVFQYLLKYIKILIGHEEGILSIFFFISIIFKSLNYDDIIFQPKKRFCSKNCYELTNSETSGMDFRLGRISGMLSMML